MFKSFNYMFKDSKFYKKTLIFFAIIFISQFLAFEAPQFLPNKDNAMSSFSASSICTGLVLLFVSLIFSCVTSGYLINCVKSIQEQKDNYVLPTLNFIKNFKIGFKYIIAYFLQGLCFSIPMIILFLLGILLSKVQPIAGIIYLILLTIFAIVIGLAVLISNIGFIWLFAKTENWTTFLRFPTLFNLIKNDGWKYFEAIIFVIVICIIIGIVNIITAGIFGVIIKNITIAGIFTTLITSAISTYAAFVNSYIYAKSITDKEEK